MVVSDPGASPAHARAAVEAVWRIEAPRLIGALARLTGDLGLAEEVASEAFAAALEQWPTQGVPQRPGAWLLTTGRRRGIDVLRRRGRFAERLALLAAPQVAPVEPEPDEVRDDLLALVLTACHPVLPPEARVALTLRVVAGLTTAEVARAYLISTAAAAQRIVRAKRALATAGVGYEVPSGRQVAERLPAVLAVIYLIFNEGHTATAGEAWVRPQLCAEAVRLARVLAALVPHEPEAHALVALLELSAARLPARTDSAGNPVLLLQQDRNRWDRTLLGHGLAALDRAVALGGAGGVLALQAAIAACHGRARHAADTDWPRIAALYAALAEVAPSPVVELNRAVAVSMCPPPGGAAAALALIEDLDLPGYHLLPSVRADLLARLGRSGEAAHQLQLAAALTHNDRERALLHQRSADLLPITTTLDKARNGPTS